MSALPLPLPEATPVPAPTPTDTTAGEIVSADPTKTAAVGPREATVRAIVVGCGIGVVLAAGNVYMGLKTAFIDGGSITAALLSFTLFSTFKQLSRHRPYTALENNITQTTASSAAIMAFVVGVSSAVPALSLMGREFPAWALCAWGIGVALMGILIGAMLRRKLVIVEALPFPTGAATAEVIETMYVGRETALLRARLLLLSALIGAGVTWFRDGQPAIIPGATMLPGTILGISAASLTLGINWSPLMASTGMFIGLRNALSLGLGAIITWAVIAPRLVAAGIIRGGGYSAFVSWLVWPGLGLMTSSTLLPLLMGWRSIGRSLRDLPQLVRRPAASGASSTAWFPMRNLVLVVSVGLIIAVSYAVFHIHPAATVAGLLLSVILAGVCSRAAGETDIAPIGNAGTVTQLLFAGFGPVVSIMSGAIASGSSSQAAQTLWAMKAGHRLKASPRAQIIGQIIGAVVGGLVVVPVYLVIVKTYGIGTESMPATSAISWKATAEAVRGGLAAMPPYGPAAGALGIALGVLMCLCAPTRAGRFLPSPMVMGIAMLMPASLSIAAVLGALVLAAVRKARPDVSDNTVAAVAAGGMAGESIMGVIIAALIASGLF
ncbi:MAG TPA: OPT/YSL family transporter [Polyangia bacterium]|jgi:uncharacterized oligopeptide transporter (OPT) family protein